MEVVVPVVSPHKKNTHAYEYNRGDEVGKSFNASGGPVANIADRQADNNSTQGVCQAGNQC